MKFKLPLLGLTLSALMSAPAWAAEPVKIGLVLPMSGPFAGYGKQIEPIHRATRQGAGNRE